LDFERVDGDTRYSEQKLTGWFDPPFVLQKGYTPEGFVDGPLVRAMKSGAILFVNELNRMPEAVQNILLPAMDEKKIQIPKLGEIRAQDGFLVIATQNPREFTATHALSEALLDRFEMIRLKYQDRNEELKMLADEAKSSMKNSDIERALDLVRSTRIHPSIKRGASVRAALAILDLVRAGVSFEKSCHMALPSRIELASSDEDSFVLIEELIQGKEQLELDEKKKTR
jgi:MoxR-like ATPase